MFPLISVGKYRTFSVDNENLYNFVKSTLQQTYSCIFDFDTYERKINIKSTSSHTTLAPVFISLDNLAKEINVNEDTANIFTCLDVNGADGVSIRNVNPMGSNKLYNFDYFMNTTHFDQGMIDRWNAWKQSFTSHQLEYYNVSIERVLKTSAILTEEAALAVLTGDDLATLENQQAVYIEFLATLSPSDSDYAEFQGKLTAVNADIAAKQLEIKTQTALIATLNAEKDVLTQELLEIQGKAAFSNFFTEDEILVLDRYIKEDSIQDSTFVVSSVDTYTQGGESSAIANLTFSFENGVVTKTAGAEEKDLYAVRGGELRCTESGNALSTNVVSASFERTSDGAFVLSAYLSNGTINGSAFPSGCISLTGKCYAVGSNVSPDADAPNAYWTGSTLAIEVISAKMYFTQNVTEYERYSVEWDLFEYGQDCLAKLAYPSYQFDVSAANFFALDDFVSFTSHLALGQKIYLALGDDQVLNPILIGVELDFEQLSSMSLIFGDKYSLSDSAFALVDLLGQSISMGKNLDVNRFGYNSFIDSGASTSVKKYMDSSLDVSKNAIISSSDIAISWGSNGIRCRKLLADGSFHPEQIAIINNNICFTDDGWQTAKMAIGKFIDPNTGASWGMVAPSLVGTLLAGQNLVIESEKKDGDVSVFRVDGDGAALHNATFDIYNGSNTQITLNPYSGIAIGSYPLYTDDKYTINETNAKFWVDTDGNVHLKGTLHGVDGTFSGELQAATGRFKGIVQASDFQDLSGKSMINSEYQFKPDYLNLKGLTISNGSRTTLEIDSNGNISMQGNITMTGGNISWSNVNSDPVSTNALNTANSAYTLADDSASDLDALVRGRYVKPNGTFINGTSVSSPKIQGGEIIGANIYGGDYWSLDGNTRMDLLDATELTPNFGGGFVLYRNKNTTIFRVVAQTVATQFYGYLGHYFLLVNPTEAIAQGRWNFSQCSSIEWGNNAPSATFG